jgi:predicted NUDIX family NTP pyrophosphohydrolase
MAAISAGLLLYRWRDGCLSVLLAHPGGPYWRRRDAGAWSIPKGEIGAGEEPEAAALREFEEELGAKPQGAPKLIGEIVQQSGKRVIAFALEGDLDAPSITSNLFELEWPPRSGRKQFFPEVDRAEWFSLGEARKKILPAQRPLLDLIESLTNAES